jgi:hypothetical protein
VGHSVKIEIEAQAVKQETEAELAAQAAGGRSEA